MSVDARLIRSTLKTLGIVNECVCIHSSFRSFGTVEGGPETVIGAFLEEGNTVMVPAFTGAFLVPPPERAVRPLQNGIRYEQTAWEPHDRIYRPDSDVIDVRVTGAIPAAVVRDPARRRGNHPSHSFAALGPLSEQLVAGQTFQDVFQPLRELARLNGYVILMGVGYDRLTLLHLAEQMAGRRPFVRWAKDRSGRTVECAIGGCSVGFNNFAAALDPVTTTAQAGPSLWRIGRARDVLDAAVAAIRANPAITSCGDPQCVRCGDALRGGPVSS